MASLLSSSPVSAKSLVGVWQLVEVNALSLQDSPPYGQLNRKEVYTAEGDLLVARPDAPFASAEKLGHYEVHDTVRTFTSPHGEELQTVIQWEDADHFFLEFHPGERWYYARVTGEDARERQWEPRSVAVVRTSEEKGPALRHFAYDRTDDSKMPWGQRVLGAWEMIKVAGRAVSGPDTPPYGMPNDRLLFGRDGTLRRRSAIGAAANDEEAVDFRVVGNEIAVAHGEVSFHFWFNHWGQLVLEQDGLQTVLKRISFDADKAPAGPVVIVLLSNKSEEPKLTQGKLGEIPKDRALAAVPFNEPSPGRHPTGQALPAKQTFRQPYNGGARPEDLALADDPDSFEHGNPINLAARSRGLGSTSEILDTNVAEKFCTLRADAIDSELSVPFGWHMADNGDRMLIYDADHFLDVSLTKAAAKAGPKALLEDRLAALRTTRPEAESQWMDNGGGAFVLIIHGPTIGAETKTRVYFTRDIGVTGQTLLGEMTMSPQDLIRGLNLMEILTRDLTHKP